MPSSQINLFDAAIYLALFVAVVMGFMTGMLRSLATIFGYLAAAPIAVMLTPLAHDAITKLLHLPPTQPWVEFAAIFLAAGLVLGAMCRAAVSEMVGEQVSIPDRVAGALLGAVRVGLLAIVLVLVFDRIIPPGRDRLSSGARNGGRCCRGWAGKACSSLPPDVEAYIDRMKRQRGLVNRGGGKGHRNYPCHRSLLRLH